MLDHFLERTPAERAVNVLYLEEFRGQGRFEHAAVIGQPGEIGAAIRIAVSRAEPVGGKTGWRAAMPVTQWVWVKP